MESQNIIKKMVIGEQDKLFGSFGMINMYLGYMNSGLTVMVTMHTQG